MIYIDRVHDGLLASPFGFACCLLGNKMKASLSFVECNAENALPPTYMQGLSESGIIFC